MLDVPIPALVPQNSPLSIPNPIPLVKGVAEALALSIAGKINEHFYSFVISGDDAVTIARIIESLIPEGINEGEWEKSPCEK